MNYILIGNVKDKIIENKYLEQFKDYLKAYENDKAYILKAKNINIRTPKQAGTASDNLLKHLKKAVEELNNVGDPKKASEKTQRYYNVMVQFSAVSKKSEKRGGPKKWILDEDKVPDAQDFANVSDKYLSWKRCIQQFFPGKEYWEAYGS